MYVMDYDLIDFRYIPSHGGEALVVDIGVNLDDLNKRYPIYNTALSDPIGSDRLNPCDK